MMYQTETVTLYKDANGNLYYDEGISIDGVQHLLVLVEEDHGHYINTNETWYATDEELANYTTIQVEV